MYFLSQGELVYVNYASIDDFQHLINDKEINITDKVVIARYGKIYHGDKVKWNFIQYLPRQCDRRKINITVYNKEMQCKSISLSFSLILRQNLLPNLELKVLFYTLIRPITNMVKIFSIQKEEAYQLKQS